MAAVQHIVDEHLSGTKQAKVLEAGCGERCRFDMGDRVHVAGLDISEEQLRRATRLNEKICGDLQTHTLPRSKFDLIVCWYVLEHLSQPGRALVNLMDALQRNGLLILALPSVCSVKGLVTKLMPHWFHVFVYRRLLGRADAGEKDRPPFPTTLRLSTRPRAMLRFAQENGFAVECFEEFEDYAQRKLRSDCKIIRATYRLLDLLMSVITLGRFNVYLSDYVLVLRKAGSYQAGR